jgi:hypothetical protein
MRNASVLPPEAKENVVPDHNRLLSSLLPAPIRPSHLNSKFAICHTAPQTQKVIDEVIFSLNGLISRVIEFKGNTLETAIVGNERPRRHPSRSTARFR